MDEAELERLVVRLVGDGSSYKQMMEQAQTQTTATAGIVQSASAKIEGITAAMGGWASGAVALIGALGIKSFFDNALSQYETMEKATIKLGAAIRANGGEVGALMPFYNEYATRLDGLGKTAKETTLANLALAESYGVTGQQAINAARAAGALASINDGEVSSYLRLTTAIQKGNIEQAMHMARMVPQLRGIKDINEFMDRYSALLRSATIAGKEMSETSTAQFRRLSNAWGELYKDIGKYVSEFVGPVVAGFAEVVRWFTKLDDNTKIIIASILAVTVVVVAMWGAWIAGAAIFNMMTGGVLLLIGAILTGGVVLGVWISSVGGVKEAWKGFIDWIYPIWQATVSFVSAGWSLIKAGATALWSWVVQVWNRITGGTTVSWGQVRDIIRDAILYCEYAITNFGVHVELTWALIKYKTLQLTSDIREFTDEFSVGLIGISTGIGRVSGELAALDEFNRLGSRVSEGWAAFHARKMEEFARGVKNDVVPPMEDMIDRTSKATKELGKFDAALFHSADAITRWQEYKDRIALDNIRVVPTGSSIGGAQVAVMVPTASSPSIPAAAPGGAGAGSSAPIGGGLYGIHQTAQASVIALLTNIRDGIQNMADNPPVVMEGADLEG